MKLVKENNLESDIYNFRKVIVKEKEMIVSSACGNKGMLHKECHSTPHVHHYI